MTAEGCSRSPRHCKGGARRRFEAGGPHMDERLNTAAARWSVRQEADRSRWWSHGAIIRHINKMVCGEPIEGPHQGFNRLIEKRMPAGGFRDGVSVGCGSGGKEMKLLQRNLVQRFHLFEIGEFRRDQIKAKAHEHGVADRISIHIGNAMDEAPRSEFDLVYWNNSLHHMFDAEKAVRWSDVALKAGGCFAMDDFVGPTRFQWSDAEIEIASRVRGLLPDRFLVNPKSREHMLNRRVGRPSIEKMMEADPTEAADSGSIQQAVLDHFPDAAMVRTGGIIYHLALNDVLANFHDDDDMPLLDALLLLDETLAESGRSHYAVALATKH